MTFLAIASVAALGVAPQASPKPANGGSSSSSGVQGSGAGKSKGAPDLSDVLSLMESSSVGQPGGGGRFSPPGGTNLRVNSPSTASQFGPSIAVDPTDPLHLIASASDDRNGTSQSAFFASFDDGLTWSEFFDPSASDPAATFGAAGEVYFASTRMDEFGDSEIFVGRSYDGGLTVPSWVQVSQYGGSNSGNSQPHLAVDRTGGNYAGNAYVVYAGFGGEDATSTIVAATSSDGGQTWSLHFVSDGSRAFSPMAAVDSNGGLHVVFYDSIAKTIYSDSSPDGGATWGTDVAIAQADFFTIPHFVSSYPTPSLAVDTSGGPYDGNLYVVWTRGTTLGSPDVVLSTSADGGATWSTPILASDVSIRSQYSPSIDVDADGNVNIGFYDCRDDVNNRRVNYYLSRGSDGGATIQKNVKVSDADFDPTAYATGVDIVTRTGVAASNRLVHAIWTDGRNGDNDIYTAPVALDFSTDVAALSATTGGTVNFTLNPGPLFQNDAYWIVGSASGTTPGTDLYFVHLPLNYDAFFLWTLMLANTSDLPGFQGTLDATGASAASLVSGPLPPSLVGYQMDFAAVVEVGSAFRWASDATHLEIGN